MSQSAPQQDTPRAGSGAMFNAIAHRYDLLNRVLSLGNDQRWRRLLVESLALKPGQRALDLATGTADVAIQVARRHPEVKVVGVDPSEKMLEIGRVKVAELGLQARLELQLGDGQQLPFEDNSFDAACIAFGIRNVPDRPRALREMARVVRPGGRVSVLELSEPQGALARFHVHQVVPRLGALLSGAQEYRYLQSSIAVFPPAEEFGAMMEEAGLRRVQIRALTLSVCHLYITEVKSR
jgi:demethylmenaquinone methyltransferase/2-methoxy-6-polyprenyl-1,4-benzoquinol methylase